jgi:hypothetical protein
MKEKSFAVERHIQTKVCHITISASELQELLSFRVWRL